MQDLVMLVERLGALGLLALIIFYAIKVWIPRRDKLFTDDLKHQRELFAADLRSQRDLFRDSMIGFKEAIHTLTEQFAKHEDEQRQHHDREEQILTRIEGHMSEVARK